MIRWLRRRQAPKDHLVVSWSGQTLAYVLARGNVDLGYEVLKSGVERQGEVNLSGGLDDMVRRLKALSLDGLPVSVMLRPEQYQLLRIRAPAVAPDELRAAARFQILKMLDTHIDDVTIDVMRVGDGRARGAGHLGGHLFVVAARRMVIREVLDLCDAMRWNVSVIDIQETAQRNLQTALAIIEGQGRRGRASAALVLLDPLQAVLTICAEGELFYARRFDLPRVSWPAPGKKRRPCPRRRPDGATKRSTSWRWMDSQKMTRPTGSCWKCSVRWTCGTGYGPACRWMAFPCMRATAAKNWRDG